ncbi:Thymus-specific serine protease [Seminavis robusta]|uniref:Thymus-specific serine protease n=1 Tax=Seminavis robusta TaxID=568900 RepID=A0A9N8E783_9STRA|nr:Thymus-specific serine protease [Seminavis robusta]|eukprot:Sro696_g188820.1 Thymus-specific serine protease (552) ;mRNA; r:6691-8450
MIGVSSSKASSWLLTVTCILAWTAMVVEAGGISDHWRFVDILNCHHHQETRKSLSEDLYNHKVNDDDVQESYIAQRLNHFAPSHGRSFHQRYFYSTRFIIDSQKQQFAFLCVGGEGPALTKQVLVDSVHCSGDMLELAGRLHKSGHSVALFALEHRYYGKSYPVFYNDRNETVSPVTNQNLVYLSSRQALSDLAHFVQQKTLAAHSNSLQWVTFGGSYPGMLAGWARLKYPHLIHAAVSNSAPIQASLDMPSYNDRVGFDLQYERIGGSQDCLQIFREGHAQLVAAVEGDDTGLKQDIADAFHLCNASILLDKQNVQSWIGDGVVMVPAQSNDPTCNADHNPLCNIDKLCSFALQQQQHSNGTSNAWHVLAALAKQQQHSDDCLDINWNKTLDYYADPKKGVQGGLRSWLWQTCTEFGFYQTCEEDSSCPYARGYHTLEEDFEICKYAFGIEPEEVRESIQQSIEYYGGWQLKGGSRILSVNGNVDPWSTQARVNSTDELLPVYNAKGASHHFWTHRVKDTDDIEVQKARKFIYETVQKWLGLGSGTADLL